MLDSHCHLDRYQDAQAVAAEAARRGVFTIAVTNLPSHFRAGVPHMRRFAKVRLALGLHPLAAAEHAREMSDFEALLSTTSFVGEVGLDYSKEGSATKARQLESFRHVARLVSQSPKVVSLHSRGAEADLLRVLAEFRVKRAIFHWYSGSLETLGDILAAGHLLSVNPAMARSKKGREIIAHVPRTQILSETDGPHVRVGSVPARPWDAALVEQHLAKAWHCPADEARAQLWSNFMDIISHLRAGSKGPMRV
jgi:TatD DNase family protein